MNKIKKGVLVIFVLLIFYMIFIIIDKKDGEALEYCKQENSIEYCMKSIYGY